MSQEHPFWHVLNSMPSLGIISQGRLSPGRVGNQMQDNYSQKNFSGIYKWHPTPVLLPGKSHGQRSLVDYSPWIAESDTTEQLHFTLQNAAGHIYTKNCFQNAQFKDKVSFCYPFTIKYL